MKVPPEDSEETCVEGAERVSWGDGSQAGDTLTGMVPEAPGSPSRACQAQAVTLPSTARGRPMCRGRGGAPNCLQEAGRPFSFPLDKSFNLCHRFLIYETGIITVPMSQGGCED